MGDDGWICCWKRKGRIVELMVYYVETNSNNRVVSAYVELSADFKSIVSWIFMGGLSFSKVLKLHEAVPKTNLRMTA